MLTSLLLKYDMKTGVYKDLTAYKGGKQVKPKVEVYTYERVQDDEGYYDHKRIDLKKNKDYTISYKNNKLARPSSIQVPKFLLPTYREGLSGDGSFPFSVRKRTCFRYSGTMNMTTSRNFSLV